MKNRLEFKGAVIGMIFGDGNLSKERKNALLRISHSVKQREYLLWKKEFLEQLTEVSVWEGQVKCAGKMYGGLRMWTKSHPLYTGLRERFYHADRKTFDLHLLKRLTPLGFLFWYLDDGFRRNNNGHESIDLCTDNFNYMENLSLQKYMHDRWGLVAKIRKHGRCWRLGFNKREVGKIDVLFKPFEADIPDCMKYKLDFSHEEHPDMFQDEETVHGAES